MNIGLKEIEKFLEELTDAEEGVIMAFYRKKYLEL
jgi:hypothetical protein